MPWTNTSEALALAARYIVGRQCQAGGFCVYRYEHLEEPNLSDTWLALAGLRLLEVDPPRPGAIDTWLDGFHAASLYHDALHDWVFSKQMLSPTWQPDAQTVQRIQDIPLQPPKPDDKLPGCLQGLLKTVRLKAAFAHRDPAPDVVAWLRTLRHDGYGSKPNLQDTALALDLLAALGAPDDSAQTRRFVEELQSPYLGFNNTADSRSGRVETMLAGVRCCAHLGLPIRHGEVIASIVLGAQRADGAFANVPGALPTLESHYNALVLLKMLRPRHPPARQVPPKHTAGIHRP